MRIFVIMATALFIFASCSTRNKKQFKKEHRLNGVSWNIEDKLGFAFQLAANEEYLFIRNDIEGTLLTAIDKNDKSKIYNFGIKGRGSNEIVNPGSIIASESGVSMFDAGKQLLVEFTLQNNSFMPNKSEKIKEVGVIDLCKISDNVYALGGIFKQGRVLIFDSKNQTKQYGGSYPTNSDSAKLEFHVLGMAYQSLMCSRPKGDKFAMACRYGEILQIFDYDSSSKSIIESYQHNISSPEFTTFDYSGTPNFRPNETTTWNYLSVSATDEHIFALYSGRVQMQGTPFTAGCEVHVFSWNGDAVCKLMLDRDCKSISVSEKTLYGISEGENGFDIVEYSINI